MELPKAGRRGGPRPLALYLRLAALAAAMPAAPTGPPLDPRRFVDGLRAYWAHPYRRQMTEPPVVWADGPARLLDYGDPDGLPMLVVPSLINRAYILDLTVERSFLGHLAGVGYRPLLLDWGVPSGTELSSTLAIRSWLGHKRRWMPRSG